MADPGGQSEAKVCGRSLAGIAGSNLAVGHGCLSLVNVMYCTLRSLCVGPNTRPGSPVDFVTECDQVQQ